MEKHSTLLDIIDEISESVDNKHFSIIVFLDLSKACDTIDHQILLNKLNIYGVRGVALEWFPSYLTGRTQCLAIGDAWSNFSKVTCGVPQRFILGPLLFIIYKNDIVNVSTILKFVLFADNTNLFSSHDNLAKLIENINQEMTKVVNWLKINKLSLNIKNSLHFIL